MKIGILGVGSLAEYLIRGALSGPAGDGAAPPLPSSPTRGEERPVLERDGPPGGKAVEFLLSPRGARAAALGWPVAADNQAVVDGAEAVLVCLPARTGLGVLQGLRFRAGQTVCSAMAGVALADVASAVAPARAAVTMMPGHANAFGLGPSILRPADPVWQDFLSRLGPVHVLDGAAEFETAAVFGALSGASFHLMSALARWFTRHGLPPDLSRRLVAETLRGNAEVMLRAPESEAEIAAGVTTPGGITEQLVAVLQAGGGMAAWDAGLDAVLRRMTGR